MRKFFERRRVVVTGAAGTIGSEIVRQLLELDVAEVRALDNHESDLFRLETEEASDPRLHCFVADVRSIDKLSSLFSGMDYVFHAAALKHVPLCERSPFEAVNVNIAGVQNVIQAAKNGGVSRAIFTSSDKAVNPTSVMGTSKLMGERLFTAANALNSSEPTTRFASTRFGNVAGSQGSVIPLFCAQIAKGGPVTLTSGEMTRFVMTISEAVHLVLRSLTLAQGGEVFVTKMPVVHIGTLAEVMIGLLAPAFGYQPSDIEIVSVGPRSGEKYFEELTTEEEMRRTYALDDFLVVLPAFRNIYDNISYKYLGIPDSLVSKTYVSSKETPLSSDELKNFLLQPGVLSEEVRTRITADAQPGALLQARRKSA